MHDICLPRWKGTVLVRKFLILLSKPSLSPCPGRTDLAN